MELALFRNKTRQVIAIFPFQRTSPGHAEPVGGRLNDVHGTISLPGVQGDLLQRMMRQSGLGSIGFHAGLPDDPNLGPFQFRTLDSHFLDLSQGWESYYRWAKRNSSTIKRHGQKSRALARDTGELRFEFNCDSAGALERLIELKRAKYQRSKTFDILSVSWAAELLREIRQISQPGFQGILSILWAGDTFVAGHMGMLTDKMLHYWFPVFDPAFSKYSPGTELLLRVTREVCDRGLTKLDLGYGDDAYKFRFANATEHVLCGRVTESRLGFQIAQQRYFWRQRLKQIPMKGCRQKSVAEGLPRFRRVELQVVRAAAGQWYSIRLNTGYFFSFSAPPRKARLIRKAQPTIEASQASIISQQA